MKVPTIRYKAGELYTNINFAFSKATDEAERTGKPVTIYSMINRSQCVHAIVQPKIKG